LPQVSESLREERYSKVQPASLLQTPPPNNSQPVVHSFSPNAPTSDASSHEKRPHKNLRNYMPNPSSQIFERRTEGYSIAQLQQLALQNNPMLMKKQREIQAVYGQWLQAGLYKNPSIGFLSDDYSDRGTMGKQSLSVEQEIIRGNKLALSRGVERWSLEIAKKELEIAQRKVENDVRALAYDVIFFGNLAIAYQELAEITEESVRLFESLVGTDELGKSDLLQHRILCNRTIVELAKAEQDEQKKWEELAALIGQPNLVKRPMIDRLRDVNQNLIFETELRRLIAESPELQAEYFRKQKANCTIARAKAENVSNVTVGGSFAYNVSNETFFAGVGVRMPLRVYDRNQGNIRRTQADSMAQSNEIERIQLKLRTRLLSEWNGYAKSIKVIRQYEETILPDARESVDLLIKSTKQGETVSLEQLIAQETYIQTIIEYLNAWHDMAISATYVEGLLLKGGLAGE
jgi:cobalt-zinc-cadmium efflux system outer membrane protein